MTLRSDSVEPQGSLLEYAEAVRRRYMRASKKLKTKILDEFVAATGLYRKAVIRLLNRRGRSPRKKRSGQLHGEDYDISVCEIYSGANMLFTASFSSYESDEVNSDKRYNLFLIYELMLICISTGIGSPVMFYLDQVEAVIGFSLNVARWFRMYYSIFGFKNGYLLW